MWYDKSYRVVVTSWEVSYSVDPQSARIMDCFRTCADKIPCHMHGGVVLRHVGILLRQG
jgi:hypothetical protein